jgi:hypothetical protein
LGIKIIRVGLFTIAAGSKGGLAKTPSKFFSFCQIQSTYPEIVRLPFRANGHSLEPIVASPTGSTPENAFFLKLTFLFV